MVTSSSSTTTTLLTTTSPFRIGDYVLYKYGNVLGYISTITLGESTVSVKHAIGNTTVDEVPWSHFQPDIHNQTSSRSGLLQYSRNAPNPNPNTNTANISNTSSTSTVTIPISTNTTTPTSILSPTNPLFKLLSLFKNSRVWQLGTPHPLVNYIKTNGKEKKKGWIRELLGMNAENSSQLTSNEKSSCLMMFSLLLGSPNNSQFYRMIKNLSDGWGISKKHLHRMFDKFVSDKLQVRRKEQSDKGENVFNLVRKRTQQFTPLNMYKQMRTK